MKLYRASLLGHVLAVATDGDENELDAARATQLRISRLSETDANGRLQTSDFYGSSLMAAVLSARNDAGLPFETLALNEPCGIVTRTYIQPHELTAAAAASDDAISFIALLHGDVLKIFSDDDDDDDSYLRIMELSFVGRDDSVLLCGESLDACIDAVRRNFDVCKVVKNAAPVQQRKHAQSHAHPDQVD